MSDTPTPADHKVLVRTCNGGCVMCAKIEALAMEQAGHPHLDVLMHTNGKMFVCPICGNKRCPTASDHRMKCTGSNELGQIGSVYAAAAGFRVVPVPDEDAQEDWVIDACQVIGEYCGSDGSDDEHNDWVAGMAQALWPLAARFVLGRDAQ